MTPKFLAWAIRRIELPRWKDGLLKYGHPSESTRDWLQDPSWIPKSSDARVLYIKWHTTVVPHIRGLPLSVVSKVG